MFEILTVTPRNGTITKIIKIVQSEPAVLNLTTWCCIYNPTNREGRLDRQYGRQTLLQV